jgi:hypothetical protein
MFLSYFAIVVYRGKQEATRLLYNNRVHVPGYPQNVPPQKRAILSLY